MSRELATHAKVSVTFTFATPINHSDGSSNREAIAHIREFYATDPKAAYEAWHKAEQRNKPQVTALPLGPRTQFPELIPKPSQGKLF